MKNTIAYICALLLGARLVHASPDAPSASTNQSATDQLTTEVSSNSASDDATGASVDRALKEKLDSTVISYQKSQDCPISIVIDSIRTELKRAFPKEPTLTIIYSDGVDLKETIDLDIEQKTLSQLMTAVSIAAGVTFEIKDGMLVVKNTIAVSPNPAAALLKKLDSIRIPKLDLRNASIHDVVEYLQQQSIENDPDKVGVNFILQSGASSVHESPVTFQAKNQSLSQVLKILTKLTGISMTIHGGLVMLTLPTESKSPTLSCDDPFIKSTNAPALEAKPESGVAD